MFRKTYKVVVLAIVLGVLLNACSKRQAVTEEYNTISDLAYSEKCKIEPIIYIEEKAGFVPYIVLTLNECVSAKLVRKLFCERCEQNNLLITNIVKLRLPRFFG